MKLRLWVKVTRKVKMRKNELITGEVYNPFQRFKANLLIPRTISRIPVKILSQGAKLTFGRFRMYAGRDNRTHPKRETLADELGCSTRQVDNYIKELVDFGLISVKRTGCGRANRYSFIWNNILDENYCDNDSQDSSGTDLQDSVIPYKEVHISRNNEGSKTATADSLSFDELREKAMSVYATYCEKINSRYPLSYEAEMVIIERLKTFTVEELKQAISNFSLDSWYIRTHRYDDIKHFFRDNERIHQRMELEPNLKEDNKVIII